MKRFIRLAVLAAGLLGLFGTNAPPAQAETVANATFVATIQVTGGIGYPVLTLPAPSDPPAMQCLPLPDPTLDTSPTNCHPVYEHRRSVTVASTVCVDEAVNYMKPSAPAHAGPCSFGGGGYVEGHCGLSGGQITVFFTDALGTTASISIHFTGVAGSITFTGHYHGHHTGLVVGEVAAVPVVEVGGQSCTNKSQQDFTVAGTAEVTSVP